MNVKSTSRKIQLLLCILSANITHCIQSGSFEHQHEHKKLCDATPENDQAQTNELRKDAHKITSLLYDTLHFRQRHKDEKDTADYSEGILNMLLQKIPFTKADDFPDCPEHGPLTHCLIHSADSAMLLMFAQRQLVNHKPNQSGKTPLFQAAFYERFKLLEILLQYGADKKDLDEALITALSGGWYGPTDWIIHAVKELVRLGANPNATDTNGDTIFSLILKKERLGAMDPDYIKALLGAGADPDLRIQKIASFQ